jgi:DNA-directed RNA polymerase beta' subunit
MKCPGHFGHMELKQTVFHLGYFKRLLKTLKCFCFECGKLMIDVSSYKLKRIKKNKYNLIKMQANMIRLEEACRQVGLVINK